MKLTKIETLEKMVKSSQLKVDLLESELEKMNKQSKSNNIIIRGIKPDPNLHPTVCAQQFFENSLHAEPSMFRICSAKYLYSKNGKTSVVLSLGAPNDKAYLFSKVNNLKGTNLSLADDLTQKQQETRNILLQKRRELIDNKVGKVIKVYDKSLKVDNKWYDLKENGVMEIRPISNNRPLNRA